MNDKRAWSEEFNSLKDFIDVLNTPNNSSGMFGRTAAATIIELEAERDALRLKLIETAQELNCMIDMANAKIEQNISATDATPPDYFDAQTVHEAMILVKKLEGEG